MQKKIKLLYCKVAVTELIFLIATERRRWHFLIEMFLLALQSHRIFSANFCQVALFKRREHVEIPQNF